MPTYSAAGAQVAIGTAATVCVMQITAGATRAALVREVIVSFDGTSTTDDQLLVTITRDSSEGTSSGTITPTPMKTEDRAAQFTVAETFSANPTVTSTLYRAAAHPQGGYAHRFAVAITLKPTERLGIVCENLDSGTAVDAVCSATVSEV